MSEEVMAFLEWAEWVLVTEIPPVLIVTVFAWVLARRYWPRKRPTAIAAAITLVALCSTWLAFATVFRWSSGISPEWFAIITASMIVLQPWAAFLLMAQAAYIEYGSRGAPRRRIGEENYDSPQ